MPETPTPATPALGILLLSREHERAHYAFVLAAGAAAIDRPVVVFATNGGLHALCRDWSGLSGADRDAHLRERGLAGLDELRRCCAELGVSMLACDGGLRAEAIAPDLLLGNVAVAGVVTFLSQAAHIVTV